MPIMTNTVIKSICKGVTLSAALAVSTGLYAQAPVYDVNSSDELTKRIEILERIVKNRTEMQHQLQEQLVLMQEEIDTLRGAVEVNTNELQKVLERQRELYLEIDKRVEALKQAGVVAGGGDSTVLPSSTQPAVTPQQGTAPTVSESEAYESAVNLILRSREYDKAIPAFQSFIAQFPNSEYAPNAHYWLGQLLFNKQQWSESTEQFSIVIERFADSAKGPDALLKLGMIAERTGDVATARERLQRVISEYPDSSARQLAESRLEKL
ncbi:tol-pal system protein YbgF [Alteromonas sp. KUL49]|nr:tol-pal system protein YbgF [Alteromonas sp. KUL49]